MTLTASYIPHNLIGLAKVYGSFMTVLLQGEILKKMSQFGGIKNAQQLSLSGMCYICMYLILQRNYIACLAGFLSKRGFKYLPNYLKAMHTLNPQKHRY
jgi:hypothetical protein